MKKRDTFMTPDQWDDPRQDYWDWYIDSRLEGIVKYQARLGAFDLDPDGPRRLWWAIFRERLQFLVAHYSRGDDVTTLPPMFQPIVDALDAYAHASGHETFNFMVLESYVRALWLVSLAVLLDAEQEQLQRLVRLISNRGQDALFDRLVALRLPGHTPAPRLLHPRPYEFLYRALDAPADERSSLIAEFLRRYYRGMRHCDWYDSHLGAGFCGYWCFELAAFVKVLQIPDESFADNVYYPRDLVRVG